MATTISISHGKAPLTVGRGGGGRDGAAMAALHSTIGTISARICHELSGSMGTLMGALGCLDIEQAGPDDEAFLLAKDAARILVARLRLMRAAWTGVDRDLNPADVAALMDGVVGRERLAIDLSALPEWPLPAPMARLLLNALMLAAEALPRGGTIRARAARHAAGAIIVEISGLRAAWPAHLGACLRDPAEIAAQLAGERRVQAALTVLIADDGGLTLEQVAAADGQPPALLLQG